jgi:hypothetical protein
LPFLDFALCCYWIIVFILGKTLSKPPGDLFFGIIFGEFLLAIHWILSAFFTINYKGKI